MAQTRDAHWTTVDRYLTDHVVPHDPALDDVLRAIDAAGLPSISVSPNLGKLLYLYARMISARNVLEIGTLGAYSTIWLGRAVAPSGRVITLEADPKHADVARANLARAGLTGVVELRLGRASETLPALAAEGVGPFDLTFIDADKVSTVDYFNWALDHSHVGSLIIVDNVVRDGAVADPTSTDVSVKGMQRFFERLAGERRVEATALQTVGSKGYDGFAIARVLTNPQ
jgi:predicted O-methyltransferase YrrM